MPLMDHIRELRKLVMVSACAWLVCGVVSYFFYDRLVEWLMQPFSQLGGGSVNTLYITHLLEGFLTQVKVSFLFGLILSFPVHVYTVLKFVFPGLKPKEKRIILGVVVAAMGLALLGFYEAYFLMIPMSVRFLTGQGFIPQNVGVLLQYQPSIFYVFDMVLWSLLFFQFPLILEVLMLFNLVSRRTLWNAGRYIVILIFVIAAIVTPPDFISQLMVALPLIALFYCSLGVAKLFGFGDFPKRVD